MNVLANKSFNVKIHFSETGEAVIGAVLGFFDVSEDIYDILPVQDSTVRDIAKALHITKSSRTVLSPKRSVNKGNDASLNSLVESMV